MNKDMVRYVGLINPETLEPATTESGRELMVVVHHKLDDEVGVLLEKIDEMDARESLDLLYANGNVAALVSLVMCSLPGSVWCADT